MWTCRLLTGQWPGPRAGGHPAVLSHTVGVAVGVAVGVSGKNKAKTSE